MTQIELRDLQLFELEMLKDLRNVCSENGIRFFLSGGTCLGAVRHRGFIPWDDDIDVMMPYPDYVRFLVLAPAALGKQYFVQTSSTDDSFQFPYARLRRDHTTMIRPWETDSGHHGIWLDIFPLIYVGGKLDVRIKKLLISLTNLLCTSDESFAIGKPWLIACNGKRKVAIISAVRKLLGRSKKPLSNWIRRKMFSQKRKANMAEAWGSITAVVPAKAFSGEPQFLPFEDDVFPVPPDYDCVLRCNYGDYMTPPPEDKRQSNHGDMIIDFEHDWATMKRMGLVPPSEEQQ